MRGFDPQTVIPGAHPVLMKDADGILQPVYDRKGRQQFNMPKPVRHVIHFRSMGARVKFRRVQLETIAKLKAGSITAKEADAALQNLLKSCIHQVPIYRGLDRNIASYYIGQSRRRNRIADMKAKLAELAKAATASVTGMLKAA